MLGALVVVAFALVAYAALMLVGLAAVDTPCTTAAGRLVTASAVPFVLACVLGSVLVARSGGARGIGMGIVSFVVAAVGAFVVLVFAYGAGACGG